MKFIEIYIMYHVWLVGKSSSSPVFLSLKCWIPSLFCKSLKPVTGTCELPVAKTSNFIRSSLLNSLTHCVLCIYNLLLN